ncbi:peptide chain release factor N(5)-glutamine methyltransferase [Tepidimicrobium xylanilyticum]|uniref:Release factor glutamine methyltransferase n=1 Tax=Tepidimicrobium xylanilyticum TaxID=1123352 RepID=A0A1H2R408_9FIRM|nr:peptide chain release factor N(5)-glutamine methyltransferase [Tepidimicrobium xylanilyticum]SDW14166.1 release factor glutamine methyltransferase [Tepidimicrobium xylanilyticum]
MEINRLLQKGIDLIKDRPYTNPSLEATLLLSRLLKVDKIYIYTHGKEKVSEPVVEKFLELIEKRAKGYPIQYIINEKEFMGLDFYVEEGVLIPRSDTEILVDYVLGYIDNKYKNKSINLLDLGFGSGAIALSVAYYRSSVTVYGVDMYDAPIRVAEINKERFKLTNVHLFKGDLFQGIKDVKEKFHIIASNPPYIPSDDIDKLQDEIKYYEPREALDGGSDGLNFYRRIIPESKKYLTDEGLLIFEIGYDQGQSVKNMLLVEGFVNVNILKDLQGLDRVVLGVFKKELNI